MTDIRHDDQSSLGIWQHLTDRVERRLDAFPGIAGLYLKDLTTGNQISVRANEIFPTASSIKIHVLTQLLRRAAAGEIDLSEMVPLTAEHMVPGSGILTYLEGNVVLSKLDVAILMIIASDNSATNMCIDWAGMPETNALINDLGLTQTVLQRKMQDHSAIARGAENISTPLEMVGMLVHLHEGRPSSDVASQCLTILKKPKRGIIDRAIPANTVIANKPGGMERVRCDAGIVYLPNRPYAVAIMSKFCITDAATQDHLLIDTCQTIHETMVVLDSTNQYGQGISQKL